MLGGSVGGLVANGKETTDKLRLPLVERQVEPRGPMVNACHDPALPSDAVSCRFEGRVELGGDRLSA